MTSGPPGTGSLEPGDTTENPACFISVNYFGDELYSELLAAVGTFSPVTALDVIAFRTVFSFQMCDVSFRFHSRTS